MRSIEAAETSFARSRPWGIVASRAALDAAVGLLIGTVAVLLSISLAAVS